MPGLFWIPWQTIQFTLTWNRGGMELVASERSVAVFWFAQPPLLSRVHLYFAAMCPEFVFERLWNPCGSDGRNSPIYGPLLALFVFIIYVVCSKTESACVAVLTLDFYIHTPLLTSFLSTPASQVSKLLPSEEERRMWRRSLLAGDQLHARRWT